ncbi:uncharacterized protein Dwil_GK25769 [Drosophila willistoni]|uniref:Uncharacterized protein n=1 Tax=Drosophila willistoni TaxID=7260 RepID=B4NC14_DROWI|nr:uncharacterized protein LOC6649041 [Drosophila willistoni]EDW82373.1 uncharacterized protein Dwil_GK25769 [Drosophila willistoni]
MDSLRNHTMGSSNNNNNLESPQQQQPDPGLVQAMGYVREFKSQAAAFQLLKSEESLVLLQRSIALLGTTVQPHYYAPGSDNVELAKFFVDLHALMAALDGDGDNDTLWACVALVQHCSRNLEARLAIVEKYCFVPLLSLLLKRTKRQERVHRLLVLLQDLTYGIRIDWEEPYLVQLLEHLVDIIHNVDGDEGNPTSIASDAGEVDAQALLAVSILVNLCYKNFVVLFLFLRTVNVSSFCKRIQNFGLLAYKMLIILSEDVHPFEERELHTFLLMAFAGIEDCLRQWNVAQLRHIVDFLLDSRSHAGLHRAMLCHTHYCTNVEKLLEAIDSPRSMNDSHDELRKHQQICLDLTFQLIRYILELSYEPGNDVISLDAITKRLYEVLSNWLEFDLCSVAAIELLTIMLRCSKRTVARLIASNPGSVVNMVAKAERPETKPAQVTAILQLLLVLLGVSETEKLVLSKISESYFDKILAGPLALLPQQLNSQSLSQSEVEKSIFCLLLLINFASIAKKAYFEKCSSLLEMPQMQYVLARAMDSGNEHLVAAFLQIAQFQLFPRTAVAKHVATICSDHKKMNASNCNEQAEQWRNLSSILKGHRSLIDKELTERVNALIDSIDSSLKYNKLQSAPVSQVIELYNHRINSLHTGMLGLQQRLDQASSQLNGSIQLVNVQNAELKQFQTKNFELIVSQERLQSQCKDLQQQSIKLKSNLKNALKQISENGGQLKTGEQLLAAEKSKVTVLQKECSELKGNLNAKTEELTKLETLSKDNFSRIDKLKKSVVAYEQDIKEKLKTIEERERELTKTQKILEEQRDSRKKSEDLVCVLETQLQDKKQQIEQLENELKETEDMRKTIMSLMESKRPKRKA